MHNAPPSNFHHNGFAVEPPRFSYTCFEIHCFSPTDGIGFESFSAGVPAETGSSVSYLNF